MKIAQQGRNADALALYFGEDPARCPFEQGNFVVYIHLICFVDVLVYRQIVVQKKKKVS